MKSIYQSSIVKNLNTFYGPLLSAWDQYPIVQKHLEALAQKMWEGKPSENPSLLSQISNNHPKYLGKFKEGLSSLSFSLLDCQDCIANEYGFKDWQNLQSLAPIAYDPIFEESIELLLNGNLPSLKNQIQNHPSLIHQKSPYGHQATLLHYVASNGVEMWRQRVPLNLEEITRFLLEEGANPEAKMNIYGGAFDTYALLESSAHPFAANVGEKVLRVLSE